MSASAYDSVTDPKPVHGVSRRRAQGELLFQEMVRVEKAYTLLEGSEHKWGIDPPGVFIYSLYVDLEPTHYENRLRIDLARIYFESPWRVDVADILLEGTSRLDLAEKYFESSWRGFSSGRMVYGSRRSRLLVYLPSRPRSRGLLTPVGMTESEGEEEPHRVRERLHQPLQEWRGRRDVFANKVRLYPGLLFRRTVQATFALLIAALLSLAFVPLAAPFFVAAILIVYGGAILTDAVIRGNPFHDPRIGTLLLIAGLGTFIVATIGLVTR
jgi:hypothetical protein